MSDNLDCVELETGDNPIGAVVWLHGLGASGNDFPPVVPYLGIPADKPLRFVFPHAPTIPVSINMNMVMPAWYDIRDMDLEHRADEEGVRQSEAAIRKLIAREVERGIPTEKIILAGFSQGGAVATHTALRFQEKLAGLIALSTYLVCGDSLDAEAQDINKTLPVFQGHGSQDPMVPFKNGQALCATLEDLGHAVEFHDYPMQHEVVMEEIEAIGEFIRRCITS